MHDGSPQQTGQPKMLMTWSVVRQITTSASLPSLARFGRRSNEELGVYYLSCLCMVSSSGTGLCLSDCLKLHHSLKTGILVCVVAMPHFVKLYCCWSFCCPKCWCLRPGLYFKYCQNTGMAFCFFSGV